jgi:hypothetical protein
VRICLDLVLSTWSKEEVMFCGWLEDYQNSGKEDSVGSLIKQNS